MSDVGTSERPPPPPSLPPPDGDRDSPRLGLVLVTVAVVLVAVVVGAAAVFLPGSTDTTTKDEAPEPVAHTPVTRSLHQVLQEVDASERAMIQFQLTANRARRGSEGPEVVVEAGRQAVGRLGEIREQLTGRQLRGEEMQPVRATREAYVTHLDAWVEHLRAVIEDPSVMDRDDAAYDDINSTAEAFAEQLREAVPDEAPAELEALAALILERGFSDGSGSVPPGELVGHVHEASQTG